MFQKLRSALPINRDYAAALVTSYGLTGITVVIQLVLVPLYLTHLGKERFGVLAMIMATNSFAAIGITWMSGGMARILAERTAVNDSAGFRAAYAFSKIVYVSYALIVILAFWLFAPWLLADALSDPEIFLAIVMASIYLLISYEYNADRLAFVARHWQSRANMREAAGQIVFAACVGVGLYTKAGLPGVVVSQIAGALTVRFLAWTHWQKDVYGLRWKLNIEGAHELWQRMTGSVGRDYIVYGMLLLTLQADALIIGWLAGPELAANYYLLWRIPEVCILLLWRIPSAYTPHLIAMDTRGNREALRKGYRRGLFTMVALAGTAALIYALLGHGIVRLWVGDNAPSAFWPYTVAAGAMFFIAVSRWPAELAYSLLNTRPLVKIAALETVAKLALIILLFGVFNYTSPLIAVCLVHALGVTYLYVRLGQQTLSVDNRRHSETIERQVI